MWERQEEIRQIEREELREEKRIECARQQENCRQSDERAARHEQKIK